MDNLLHDLLLVVLVWMLLGYWLMWGISRQKRKPIKKKQPRRHGQSSPEPNPSPD